MIITAPGVFMFVVSLASGRLVVDETCPVGGPTKCEPKSINQNLKELSLDLLKTNSTNNSKTNVMVCDEKSITYYDSKTGEQTHAEKLTKSIPGVIHFMVAPQESDSQAQPAFAFAQTSNNEILELNLQTNESRVAPIPEEYRRPGTSFRFGPDGQSVIVSDHEADTEQLVPIEELFRRSGSSERESTGAARSNPAPKERFEAMNIPEERFKDLLVYDHQNQTVQRFPFVMSQQVENVSGSPIKEKEVYISKAGDFAVTYSPNGTARIWENPISSTPIERYPNAIANSKAEESGHTNSDSAEISSERNTSTTKLQELGADTPREDRAKALADRILSQVPGMGPVPIETQKQNNLHNGLDKKAEGPITALDIMEARMRVLTNQILASQSDPRLQEAMASRNGNKKVQESSRKGEESIEIVDVARNTDEASSKSFGDLDFVPTSGTLDTDAKPADSETDSETSTLPLLEWMFVLPARFRFRLRANSVTTA